MTRQRLGALLGVLATLALVLAPGYLWLHSRTPSTYSVMDMGYADYGGGHRVADPGMAGMTGTAGTGAHASHAAVSVADLTGPTGRRPDRVFDLTARRGTVRLPSGRTIDGYTVNGTSPGPLVEVTEGQLVQVRLHNADVADGITLHWHGVDVPNAEDGVVGVTQDAVMPGGEHTYRFVARDAGTYWYHSHQVSHEQVVRGLLGPLVVLPRAAGPADSRVADVVALLHTYDGVATLGGRSQLSVHARPGQQVRVRVINTDNGPTRAWASVPYRVVAVDGHDVHQPPDVSDRATIVTAGGREDLEVVAPEDGSAARVQVGAATSVVVGPPGAAAPAPPPPPQRVLDLLSYGRPAPIGFDPAAADRHFRYDIGRRAGFVRGRPGLWWSVNGHLFPHLPTYVVEEGDVVQVRIHNGSGDVHPMHLHGHHAVVLSRNGVRATGSPWWFDSLNVEDGATYVMAFVADNPGIWMDHCHNLTHAQQGLVTHLVYAGVSEPYRVGGDRHNEPE